MPPQLVSLTEGPNILLDKPILLLGRHQECDIQLGSRKVSRRHCCVAQVNDYLVVRDLGSTNGIRINGIRVVEGSLKPGDELTIGNQRYQLQWNAKAGDPLMSMNMGQGIEQAKQAAAARLQDAHLESSEVPVALAESELRPSLALRGVPVAGKPPARQGDYDVELAAPPVGAPDEKKRPPPSSEKQRGG